MLNEPHQVSPDSKNQHDTHDISGAAWHQDQLLDNARAQNTQVFEQIWASNSRLKQRFQYNLATARKDFLYVLKHLNIPRTNQAVLDVGFGNGMLMFLFDPTSVICGTEFSQVAIKTAYRAARQRGYNKVAFQIPINSEALPFQPNSFDIVIASHVVEHVVHDVSFLQDMVRVLKPGGHLIVLIPLDATRRGILSEEDLINPAYINAGHFHVHNYNMETLLQRMRQLNGQVVFDMADMHIWDWKVSFDEQRSKMGTHFLGKIIDRVIAGAINIPLAVLPHSGLAWLDQRFADLGYRPRQATVALRKQA